MDALGSSWSSFFFPWETERHKALDSTRHKLDSDDKEFEKACGTSEARDKLQCDADKHTGSLSIISVSLNGNQWVFFSSLNSGEPHQRSATRQLEEKIGPINSFLDTVVLGSFSHPVWRPLALSGFSYLHVNRPKKYNFFVFCPIFFPPYNQGQPSCYFPCFSLIFFFWCQKQKRPKLSAPCYSQRPLNTGTIALISESS